VNSLTLWDVITGRGDRRKQRRAGPKTDQAPPRRSDGTAARLKPPAPKRPRQTHRQPPKAGTMAARYAAIEREMLARYQVRVRKWRSSTSGVAWAITYADGSVSRLIESPRPRGPMSCAVFLHEIGHHAIGLGHCKPRCLEEYRAWCFALDTMCEHGLNVTEAVERRMYLALCYAVHKARRRGLRRLPSDLARYLAQETHRFGPHPGSETPEAGD